MSLAGPEALVDPRSYQDPEAVYSLMADLRANAPVCYAEPDGFRPFWVLSRYEDIKYVEGHSELFSASPRAICIPEEVELLNKEVFGTAASGNTLAHMDGDFHRKHRMVAQPWFLARQLKALEPMLEDLADQYAEKMASLGGECDFATEISNRYPLRVAMSLLGVPPEDDNKLLMMTQRFFGFQDEEYQSGDISPSEGMVSALTGFFEYFQSVTRARRESPTDDLASLLANAKVDGEPMGEMELNSYYALLATAGHDTTAACICGGLKALIENPEQMQKLRNNPELITNAVEEIIRYVAPTKHFMRTAREDVELNGQLIKRGESVLLLWASACRDESVFESPNRFDIERANAKNHLAFGFGPHVCLGKQLARMEIAALLRKVLSRFSDFEITENPEYVNGYFVVGLKRLPVRYRVNV